MRWVIYIMRSSSFKAAYDCWVFSFGKISFPFPLVLTRIIGKISAQPHPTLCIQFLNIENNDKNNTFPLGKQICFTIVWGCAETLANNLFDNQELPKLAIITFFSWS